jgi:hypothetical protein
VIPTEGSEDSKRPPAPPVPEASDDETFEDRLRHAIVRHFQFSWSELAHARRAEREKPESETIESGGPEASACAPAEQPPNSATASPLSPGASAEAPPSPPGGNGSGPAHSSESGPTLPPDRPAF